MNFQERFTMLVWELYWGGRWGEAVNGLARNFGFLLIGFEMNA